MQVLSLSELPLSGGEPGNQFNVQGWVKEREDLLATVDSLKGLITQMKTRRETQVEETCQGPVKSDMVDSDVKLSSLSFEMDKSSSLLVC